MNSTLLQPNLGRLRLYMAVSTILTGVVLAGVARAAEPEGEKPDPRPVRAPVELSFEQFVAQCANPEQGQVQRAPREIRLVCSNREVTWLAAQPGALPLPGSRQVSTALLSDKFRVSSGTRAVEVSARAGSCHRFEEVVETFTTEVPMTCEDVVGIKVAIEEYCSQELDEQKDRNPKATTTERTGRVIDTCASTVLPRN